MPTIVVMLFWLWFAGSVVAYFVLKARKRAVAAEESDPMALFGSPDPSEPAAIAPARPVSSAVAPASRDSASRDSAPRDSASRDSAPEVPAPEDSASEPTLLPAVAKAMADEGLDVPGHSPPPTEVPGGSHVPDDLAGIAPAVAAVIREERAASGLSTGADSTRPAILVGTRAPLVETLHGIAMPLDLAPLANLGEVPIADVNRDRLVMCTSTHEIGGVAAALRTELERIGLNVTSLNETTVIAQRGDRAVEVRLYDNPTVERTDVGRTYPTTLTGDVVVEFLAS